jgi:hypothetical protein
MNDGEVKFEESKALDRGGNCSVCPQEVYEAYICVEMEQR